MQLEEMEDLETDKTVMKTAKNDCGGCSNCASDIKAENLRAHFKGVIKKGGFIL
jgi:hypothetical protein